ncbi:MAG: hypothetical protein ACP5VR_07410 [Acidimicrobiales bacterium]
MPPADQQALERHLSPSDAAYLDKVRRATSRLATREVAPDDVRAALEAVRDVAAFNVEVPTESPRREVHLAKQAFKRAAAWYLRYLAEQLNAFAGAALRLGETLVTRVEGAEVRLDELVARVDALEKREENAPSSAVPALASVAPKRAAAVPTPSTAAPATGTAAPTSSTAAPAPGPQELRAPGRGARPSQGESGRSGKGHGGGSTNRTRQGQSSRTRRGQDGVRGTSQGQAQEGQQP